jgi:lysophospholipase L1-like esterase
MRGKAILKELSKTIGATLVVFAVVESLIRVAYFIRNSMAAYVVLPYVIGNNYGPIPPWVDGLRILEPDEALFWKNRPNLRRKYIDIFTPVHSQEERTSLLRQFLPASPDSLRDNPVWEISLNSEGFRGGDFPKLKPANVFRIICLGDSWTFGANVGQHDAYPQRLQALLRHEFPNTNFEVLNLGVLGYSSYQGLELLKSRALGLAPDVVVIGFAMNDASVAGYRDKDMPKYNKDRNTLAKGMGRVVEKIETYKLLRYLALVLKDKPTSIGQHLKAAADSAREEGFDYFARDDFRKMEDYNKLEPWTRVSLRDYEKNILEMIDVARIHKAGVILLYNELWGNIPYRMVLDRISRTAQVPLVDSSALIAEARRKIEEALEEKLDLRAPRARQALATGEVEVIFRVHLGSRAVPKVVSIVGAHPKLGDMAPNKVAMYDDGTHGDQRAGDNVWSYTATFSPGERLFYVYTNSGKESQWEGLDVPWIRSFTAEAKNNEEKVYRPIESFGKIYMLADGWHTNAAGYELIAKALLEKLKKEDTGVKRYLRQIAAN